MTQFLVSFSLEADTLEAAQAAVGTWVVSPGTILTGIMGTVMSEGMPVDLADGGTVNDAMAPSD